MNLSIFRIKSLFDALKTIPPHRSNRREHFQQLASLLPNYELVWVINLLIIWVFWELIIKENSYFHGTFHIVHLCYFIVISSRWFRSHFGYLDVIKHLIFLFVIKDVNYFAFHFVMEITDFLYKSAINLWITLFF